MQVAQERLQAPQIGHNSGATTRARLRHHVLHRFGSLQPLDAPPRNQDGDVAVWARPRRERRAMPEGEDEPGIRCPDPNRGVHFWAVGAAI